MTDLARVSASIGDAVVAFVTARAGREFRAEELRDYVAAHAPKCAPGSADRVMRALKRRRRINYTLVNQAQSIYLAHV